MIEVAARPGEVISLGRQGENLARCVLFNISPFRALYGDGSPQLLVVRPGENEPYPAVLEVEENKAKWNITTADTNLSGYNGKAELRWYVGETLAKSEVWSTSVHPALGEPRENPPEPYQSWMDQVFDIAEDVEIARDGALKAAAMSVASEGEAQKAASSAAESAGEANAYSDAAARSSSAAQESEANAGLSANAAAKSAEDAKQAAESVGVISWNDLTDRPFYEEEVEDIIVPLGDYRYNATTSIEGKPTTYEYIDDTGTYYRELEDGTLCNVLWQGKMYECLYDREIFYGGDDSFGYIGNKSIYAPFYENTGEPFLIMFHKSLNRMAIMTHTAGDSTGMMKASRQKTVIKPMESKFLPDSTPWVEEGEVVEILPDYTITEANRVQDVAGIPRPGFVVGNTYIVKFQGTEYTCVAWEEEIDGVSRVGVGDIYTWSSGQWGTTATGEPFVLIELSPNAGSHGASVTFHTIGDVSFPIVLSIASVGKATVQKLDSRCLPDDATFFTLVSPNGTKYNVTVSNDGTLSATAV